MRISRFTGLPDRGVGRLTGASCGKGMAGSRSSLEGDQPGPKQLTIRPDYPPEAIHVAGDPARLQQIVWNLLDVEVPPAPTVDAAREAGLNF